MKSRRIQGPGNLIAAVILGMVLLSTGTRAQTFSVVHSFTGGNDGGNPLAGLAIDSSGNLYGTATSGGSSGAGVVFKFGSTGAETVLYSFTGGADGGSPQSVLLLLGGNLYGTTNVGGAYGSGTVFEVTPKGKETVLYSFRGKTDGANPVAGLTEDSAGNLYGTTFAGGRNAAGTVFQLVHPKVIGGVWSEQVLHSFGGSGDGAKPVAGVTFDAVGNLYGATSAGGTYGNGTVFELKRSSSGWAENILHHFELQKDGGTPYAGLILHAGNLYGAATDGGAGSSNGGGTVFELTPSNKSWAFSVIYALEGWGISGTFRNLLFSGGKIYATTHCDGANNAGTVYELTPSGTTWDYRLLYDFTGNNDGRFVFSNLVLDKAGNLYGTTNIGGAHGEGVVFKLKP